MFHGFSANSSYDKFVLFIGMLCLRYFINRTHWWTSIGQHCFTLFTGFSGLTACLISSSAKLILVSETRY